MFAAGAPVDPFRIEQVYDPRWRDYSGRTQKSPHLDPGIRNCVIVACGQSNVANYSSASYTAVNSGSDNLDVTSGGIFAAKDPLLGANGSGGGMLARLADKLIAANVYDRVILAPMSIGGSSISLWQAGGVINPSIGVMALRLASLRLVPTFIIQVLGETDAVNGMSQAAFAAGQLSTIATFRANGLTCPYFVSLTTKYTGLSEGGATAIRAAQTQVVDNVSVFQGPDTDTIGDALRDGGVHYNGPGSDAHADLWLATIQAYIASH